MADLFDILFGEKGSFITTEEGRVIFIGGPSGGAGGSGTGQQILDTTGATALTEGDIERVVRHMTDAEFAQSNREVQFRYSQLANERDNAHRFINLQKENIPESHARNLMLSLYPEAIIGSQNVWEDLGKHLGLVEERMDDMLPIIRVIRRENIRRGIIKVKS